MSHLHALTLSAALTWVMLLTASLLRSRGWTPPGMKLAFGNREQMPPDTPLTGRADRAAKNMVENLVLFTAVLAAGRLAGVDPATLDTGSTVFLAARLAYFPVYLAGVAYLRTAIWGVSLYGMALIGHATLVS